MRIIFVTGLTALALAVYTLAAESSITTSGSDSNNGSKKSPFRTIHYAQAQAAVSAPVPADSEAGRRVPSPGHTTYFVDPLRGDDLNKGTAAQTPWHSLFKVNRLKLAPGDKVVIAPGKHEGTLMPSGAGTAPEPIVVEFLPGVHEFRAEPALQRPWFISNSNDDPGRPKPIGILIENTRHLRLQGGGVDGPGKTLILYHDRMMEWVNHGSQDIVYRGLAFDHTHPSVSEFRVLEAADTSVTIQVAEGSGYEIKDRRFAWLNDFGPGWELVQQAIPATGACWRNGDWSSKSWDPFKSAKAEDLGGHKVRLTYAEKQTDLKAGRQFQFRHVGRDMVSALNDRSGDITVESCDFYALPNMGIVSQFSENITYRKVRVAPPAGTLRTCAAWADCFHFSGCRGQITVEDCLFSGTQDDPINVHGTHLRIIGKPAENQLHLRFMQPQTYGFAAFAPGDEIAVINHASLNELPGNPRRKVTACAPMPGDTTGKDWLLTLDGPAPAFGQDDVVDNLSWYPDFTARNNFVTMDSCRGFLITTRGKVLVEGNTFNRCHMPGLLIEDDAEGWFESGPVRDMTIRNNHFIDCDIVFNPASKVPGQAVHQNIRIEGNYFEKAGISGHHVRALTITNNRFSDQVSVNLHDCQQTKVENNISRVTE